MSDEEVEAAFAAAKASGEEPEPEMAAATKSKSASTISDEDYQDWMEYSKLSDRLRSVKSNLLKTKRYRSTPGDINDVGSTAREIKGLTDLKASLEQRIDALVAKSEYLQKDIAKKAGKEYIPAPPIENPLEDEDEMDELNENVLKHRMQYYAGIKK
jgi:translation initiation factor 2B subunit (eIF-2B alpha/beta/delta family)